MQDNERRTITLNNSHRFPYMQFSAIAFDEAVRRKNLHTRGM